MSTWVPRFLIGLVFGACFSILFLWAFEFKTTLGAIICMGLSAIGFALLSLTLPSHRIEKIVTYIVRLLNP